MRFGLKWRSDRCIRIIVSKRFFGRSAQRHRIDVPGEREGRVAGSALDFRHQARAVGGELIELDGEASGFEQLREVFGTSSLGMSGIDRVESKQFLSQLDCSG